jgi:hypothetical protein
VNLGPCQEQVLVRAAVATARIAAATAPFSPLHPLFSPLHLHPRTRQIRLKCSISPQSGTSFWFRRIPADPMHPVDGGRPRWNRRAVCTVAATTSLSLLTCSRDCVVGGGTLQRMLAAPNWRLLRARLSFGAISGRWPERAASPSDCGKCRSRH